MIIKEYSKLRPICDICSEVLPAQNSFDQAKEAMKRAGWKTTIEDGEYIHICPECKDCEE